MVLTLLMVDICTRNDDLCTKPDRPAMNYTKCVHVYLDSCRLDEPIHAFSTSVDRVLCTK